MANQIYFPHYKQIFDADPAAFILISHPETGLAYKIRVDALQEALTSSLVSTDTPNGLTIGTDGLLLLDPANLITSDADNVLEIGSDDLLKAKNIYVADGRLSSNRSVDCQTFDFSIFDSSNIDFTASTHVVLTATIAGVSTGTVATLPTAAALQFTDGSVTSSIGTTVAGVVATVTSGQHINLAIPAGADLQIAGSAGNAEQVLQSNGASNPPSWKKIKHAHSFDITDWGAGTTLTIAAATHDLGFGYHNVTVFDATHNIVPIAAVLTNVNVNGTSGDVVLTIVNNAAAFSGIAYITI